MLNRLTLESLAYLFLTLTSFVIRVEAASRNLLNQEEALRALAAWNFVQGQSPEPSWPLTPGLLGFQFLAFFLFGANDVTARLPTALAGAMIPLAFSLFRSILGRDRALVAAAISALSPLWVFSSSQADGEAIGVLAILAAIGMFLRFQETGSSSWLYGTACALGVAIASGLSVWTILSEGLLLALLLRGKVRGLAQRLGTGFWMALGGSLFLTSTLFFFYPPGFGLVADSFALWLSGLFGGRVSIQPFIILVLYEPLLLLAILWAGEHLYLLVPTALGLLVAILGGMSNPAGFFPILLPLTILSAHGLCNLFRSLTREKFRLEEAVALGLTFCIGVWGFLGVIGYTVVSDFRYLLVLLGALIGAASVLVVLGIAQGFQAPARVLLTLLFLVLFLGEVKLSRGLNLSPYAEEHLPRCQFTSYEVEDLTVSLRKLSSYRAGDPTALEIVLVGEFPELEWYLKDFSALKIVEKSQPLPEAEAIVTPGEEATSPGENYLRRRFSVREKCGVKKLKGSRFLRWLIYREPLAPRDKEKAILWVKGTGLSP